MLGVPAPIAVMNCARRHVAALAARGEHRQDLGDVRRELPLRDVVAGPVGEADEVGVALDQARHDGARRAG